VTCQQSHYQECFKVIAIYAAELEPSPACVKFLKVKYKRVTISGRSAGRAPNLLLQLSTEISESGFVLDV
jgi:hypothetical protein